MVTLCFGESISVGTSTYSASGIYFDVLVSAEGCDSTVTTELTVKDAIITTVTAANEVLTADQDNAEYQWINCENNTIINGATSQVYTATANGSYAAIVTFDGCADTTVCVNVTTLSAQNVNANAQVKVYPNPSNGMITIHVPASGNCSIVNQLGQKVVESYLTVNTGNAITINEAPGVYYLQGNNDGLSVNYRIVVTK